MVSVPTGKIFEGSVAGLGPSGRISLRVSTGPLIVEILRVSVRCTSSAGVANFTPRIYDELAGVAGSINERFQASNVLVGALSDTAAEGTYLQTSADGYFFLEPGPNAGTGTFAYSIIYVVI